LGGLDYFREKDVKEPASLWTQDDPLGGLDYFREKKT
jgi:hypothetical protein